MLRAAGGVTAAQFSPYGALAQSYGTGADGTVTISSGTTTLTRDMHYANLTLSGTGILKTNGFRLFVAGTLDISAAGAGAIQINGQNGAAATTASNAGLAVPNPQMVTGSTLFQGPWGGYASGAGGVAAGAAPTGVPGLNGQNGGQAGISGNGGTSGANSGGVAPAAGGFGTWSNSVQFNYPTLHLLGSPLGNAVYMLPLGGGGASSGGGGGGGDGTNSGGAGGGGSAGGGVLGIWARIIQRGSNATAAIIQAKGGVGGAGAAGIAGNASGGGGAGGGGGGFVYIVTDSLLGSTITNAIDVSGGTGGAGGNGQGTGKGGNGGAGGNSGNVQKLVLGVPSFTVSSFNAAGSAGGTTATATGAAGGAGATLQVSL